MAEVGLRLGLEPGPVLNTVSRVDSLNEFWGDGLLGYEQGL